MPMYEYECRRCGQVFEVQQRITDPKLSKHRGCGGRVERLISSTSFVLKGSGWYKTDYAGSGKKAAGKDATDGKSDKSDTPEKKEKKADSSASKKAEAE